MSSALFFVWVNLAIALSFAAAMLAIALLDNRFRAAFWFAGSFLISSLYLIFELATAEWPHSASLATLTLTTFMGGLALINVGLSIHYKRPIARWVIPLTALVAAGLIFTAQFAFQNSLTGYIMYQAPLAAMQSIGAWVILSERRAKLDRALGVVFVLSCAHFLAKPFIALATGRFDNASQPYLSTDYAAYSQALGTVIGVALALLIIVIMVQQLLTELKRQALTDGLSGLLNRAAFHHELSRMVSRRRRRAPMSLIICDLDHFKAINDTYGHECGDQVIAEFAATRVALAGSAAKNLPSCWKPAGWARPWRPPTGCGSQATPCGWRPSPICEPSPPVSAWSKSTRMTAHRPRSAAQILPCTVPRPPGGTACALRRWNGYRSPPAAACG